MRILTNFVFLGACFFLSGGALLSAESTDFWTEAELAEKEKLMADIASEEVTGSFLDEAEEQAKTLVTDCDTWLKYTLPYTSSLNSVAFSGSRWVVAGGNDFYYSDDGLDWNWRYAGVSNNFTEVRWFNSRFIAVGEDGIIMTSSDGVDWSQQGTPASSELRGLATSPTRMVAVGRDGTVLWSVDGQNWSISNSPTSEDIFCVEFFSGKFRLIDDDGNVYDSPGGVNWLHRVVLPSFPQYGSMMGMGTSTSMLIAVGYDVTLPSPGGGVIYTTTDGSTWQKQEPPTDTLRGATFGAGKWVVVGDGTIIESVNATNWTIMPCPLSDRIWDVAYGDDQFIAAGWDGIARQTCSYTCTPPTITSHPQSQTISSGSTALLSVNASGTIPFTFQWYEGQKGNTSNPVPGATGRTFQTPVLTTTTSYWVRVSNPCGQADSNTATITVDSCTAPTISVSPSSQTVNSGSSVTLYVSASGTAPLAYQWYQGNTGNTSSPVAGATEATFDTPPLFTTTRYWVRVFNTCGQAHSNTAILTVSSSGSFEYWVPAMAHVAGLQGSQWRADVGILNRGSSSSTLDLTLYTRTQTYTASASVGSGDQLVLVDIVAETFMTIGSGHLKIEATEGLTVAARVYNQGETGTFGQGFEGFETNDGLVTGREAFLPLLSQNSGFRTNIGVSNMTDSRASVSVTLFLQNGTEVGTYSLTVQAHNWIQDNEPYKNRFHRNNVAGGYARVQVTSGSGVLVYASVVDNATGDPTTVMMRE